MIKIDVSLVELLQVSIPFLYNCMRTDGLEMENIPAVCDYITKYHEKYGYEDDYEKEQISLLISILKKVSYS